MSGVGGFFFFALEKSVNTTTIFIFRGKNYANCRNPPPDWSAKKYRIEINLVY